MIDMKPGFITVLVDTKTFFVTVLADMKPGFNTILVNNKTGFNIIVAGIKSDFNAISVVNKHGFNTIIVYTRDKSVTCARNLGLECRIRDGEG